MKKMVLDISSKDLERSLKGEINDIIKQAIMIAKKDGRWAEIIDLEARLDVIDYIIECIISVIKRDNKS